MARTQVCFHHLWAPACIHSPGTQAPCSPNSLAAPHALWSRHWLLLYAKPRESPALLACQGLGCQPPYDLNWASWLVSLGSLLKYIPCSDKMIIYVVISNKVSTTSWNQHSVVQLPQAWSHFWSWKWAQKWDPEITYFSQGVGLALSLPSPSCWQRGLA